jgi:protein HIRA/HIR1
MKTQRSFFPPVSVQPLLSSSPNCTIHEAAVRSNGAPIIQCSTGIAHSYDPLLSSWITLSERWWSEGSDVWQGRQRGNSQSGSRGVLNSVESAIGTIDDASAAEKPRPAWWNTALTLGHLETRLHSTRVLDSPQEYKQALLLYAKKISDEAFKGKAEELIKELYGPIYWCVACVSV